METSNSQPKETTLYFNTMPGNLEHESLEERINRFSIAILDNEHMTLNLEYEFLTYKKTKETPLHTFEGFTMRSPDIQ